MTKQEIKIHCLDLACSVIQNVMQVSPKRKEETKEITVLAEKFYQWLVLGKK